MTRNRLVTIIIGGCCVIAVMGVAAEFNYETHYAINNPQTPDAKTGRIYQNSWRGRVFYVDAHEQFMLRMVNAAANFGVLGGLIAAYFLYRRKPGQSK